MTMIRKPGAWWCPMILVLVLVPAARLIAQTGEPAKKKAQARETLASLKALNASVKKDGKADAKAATVAFPPRPARSVSRRRSARPGSMCWSRSS